MLDKRRSDCLTWIGRHERSCLDTALHIEEIPDLVESGIAALNSRLDSSGLGKSRIDLGGCVCFAGRWDDAGGGKERVGI